MKSDPELLNDRELDRVPVRDGCKYLEPYRLVRRIGSERLGGRFLAWRESLGLARELQLISVLWLEDEGYASRFQARIAALRSLEDPHVASVFGYHEQHGVRYAEIEHAGGTNLTELMADRAAALPLDESLRIGLGIASGLKAAHRSAAALGHADLVPEAVRIRGQGAEGIQQVVLTGHEFPGIPEFEDGPMLMRPPAYMAPEVMLTGEGSLSPAADIYSLGAICCFLLLGRSPHAGRKTFDILRMAHEGDLDLTAELPDLPRAAQELLQSFTARDPEQRPRDGGVAEDRIEQALDDLGIEPDWRG